MSKYKLVSVDLLSELAESLACELDARYPASIRSYESQDRKYRAEMEPVFEVRQIIAAAPDVQGGAGGGRICSGCKSEFEWQLDKNQRPLIGSNRMSKTEVAIDDSKENSIDVERKIDFIKQLVRERDAASITLNIARQRMLDAEESFSIAEDVLHDAREQLKDYLVDEGVL